MYEPLLLIHSWVRWAVLLGAIYFFLVSIYSWLRKRAWSAMDDHFIWAFNQIFMIQVLFGFTIWIAASPIVRTALMNPRIIFDSPVFEFWVLRHPITMIIAVGVLHMGKSKAKTKPNESQFKLYVITFGIILLLVLSAIPWPSLSYGRGLFRSF